MNTEIKTLTTTTLCGQTFSVYGTKEEPFFLAKEVADIIEHQNITHLVNMVDEDEKLIYTLCNSGQNRQMWFLTESGLYEVLMQSRKPIAKQFKKGVKEILKKIRTEGGYIAATQHETPEQIMAKAILLAQKTIEDKQQQIEQLKERTDQQTRQLKQQAPKVIYFDEVLNANNTLTFTQVAKAMGKSVKQLTDKLKECNIIYRQSGQWMLKEPYIHHNLHATRTSSYTRSNGQTNISLYTVWTQKGRYFIEQLFRNEFHKPIIILNQINQERIIK